MRVLRGLAGTVLWVLAAVVGLVGVLLCVTVILLPVGIPLVMMARRLFSSAVRLMLPRQRPARRRTSPARAGRRRAACDGASGEETR